MLVYPPCALPRKIINGWAGPPALTARSGMPSPLKSPRAVARGLFVGKLSPSGVGQWIPATAAPRFAFAKAELPFEVSKKDTDPVGAAVPPYSVTVTVSG
jgi:hypothetical protein